MKVLRIILLALLVIVVVIAIGGFVIYNDTTRGPLPQHNGTISVSGLTAPVEILRDPYGVPHIYAANLSDLYFAQGYTQAQDRWWQMEFWRHIGRGAIQELTGKNDALMGTDVFIRTAGWYRAAQRDIENLQQIDPETISHLQSFTDGINAYITSRPADDLALEYRLLGITGVNITIEPWTIVDSAAWGKVMSWNLTGSYGRELIRASLFENLGEDMANDYTPPYPYGEMPTIVFPEDLPISEESLAQANALIEAARTAPPSLRVAGGLHAASTISDYGVGSNNWVATDSMTESGMPLMANDPHLGIQMPSIWYEVGLHCQPVSETCPLDVVGFTFSASPGVVIGHNARIAWAVTNVGADVQDLYRITVNPDNPLQYMYNGEWTDMTVYDETIQFGDGEPPITIQVRETVWGPIINDNDIDPDTGELLGFNNEDPLALRWVGHDASTLIKSIGMINRASNWEEFREALTYWTIPSQNFVYADVDGNIGYQTPGAIPYRAPNHDGLSPVDGSSDEFAWRGYIPFDNLPRVFNPERDYIATANQAVVPLEYYDQLADIIGEDANYLLSYDWSYGYRGARIVELMEALAPHTPETYAQIHGDNKSLAAQAIIPFLNDISFDDATVTEARDWLAAWNFQQDMDSAEAVLWNVFLYKLIDAVFADQLPEDISASDHQAFSVSVMMSEPDNVWWDDITTTDTIETRDDILRRVFEQSWADATAAYGTDRTAWRWGAVHTATFVSNPLGLSGISLIEDMVNRGPFETAGGSEIVNATGSGSDFTVDALPSMRMIVDVGNFENSRTIHTTGQSGHPFSDHYSDMTDMWRNIEYKPMLWTRQQVEAAAESTLTLTPGS